MGEEEKQEQGFSIIRQAMIKNALVKLKEGKSLTKREEELLEEAQERRNQENQEAAVVGPSSAVVFKNLREVVGYLREQGWKISQAGLYKHSSEGKIKSEKDGTYTVKNVLRYAKGFLTTRETKRKEDDEELQRRKTKLEIALKDEQLKRERIKRMVDEGRYILREQFESELAARASVIESVLKFMIQSDAGEWIAATGGNNERTGDLIRIMNDNLDQALNEFSTLKEFHVIFKIPYSTE